MWGGGPCAAGFILNWGWISDSKVLRRPLKVLHSSDLGCPGEGLRGLLTTICNGKKSKEKNVAATKPSF